MPARRTDEWIQALQAAGIPAVPLKTLKELMSDPHLEQTGFFVSRQTKEGKLRFPGIPTHFSRTPVHIREAGPELGEHTVPIMQEAGFTATEIESYLQAGDAGTTRTTRTTPEDPGPVIV